MPINIPLLPLLAVLVSTFMAAVLLSRQDPSRVWAGASHGGNSPQTMPVTAFSFPLAPGIEGIVLIDHQNQTICIYQYEQQRPAHQRFSLVAARNYSYDCRLTDFNNADPSPEVVKQWVQRTWQLPEPNRTGEKIIKK